MKKVISILTVAIILCGLVGCSQKYENEEALVQTMIEAFKAGNVNTFYDCFTDSEEMKSKMGDTLLVSDVNQKMRDLLKDVQCTIKEIKVDGQNRVGKLEIQVNNFGAAYESAQETYELEQAILIRAQDEEKLQEMRKPEYFFDLVVYEVKEIGVCIASVDIKLISTGNGEFKIENSIDLVDALHGYMISKIFYQVGINIYD